MATIAFFYEVCALLVAVLMFVTFLRGVQGVPLPPETRARRHGPLTGMSVVVLIEPEADAEHCVAALLAQDYPQLDIIFVLQGGAELDATTAARLEDDPRARVLVAADPPPGWTRQNDAYAAGFRETRHEYILFMDGNVLVREQGLERVLSLARQRGADLLTIFPAMTSTTRVERLLVPFFMQLTLTGVSMRKINDAQSDAAGGFAPFFLFRRAAYEALGGHGAVRADRFSDSSLAQRVKDRGYRLLLTDGTEIAVLQGQSRLRDIWSSWSQGFSDAIDNDLRQALLLAGLVVALFALPWMLFVGALLDVFLSPGPVATSPWLGVVLMGSANIMLGLLHRRSLRNVLDVDDSLAWLQPVAALITAAMIVVAALDIDGRWPGRRAVAESGAVQPTGTNR
jgi:GT2 family glycosyltransferase